MAKKPDAERDDGAKGRGALNLVKLCVGADGPADLQRWLTERAAAGGAGWRPRHTTRMQPKRGGELLAGGSLYWVFRGAIRARQSLLAIEPAQGADGIQRYDLVLDNRLVLTAAQPRRPFQGWRYLTAADAPPDLREGAVRDERLSAELAEELDRLGVV